MADISLSTVTKVQVALSQNGRPMNKHIIACAVANNICEPGTTEHEIEFFLTLGEIRQSGTLSSIPGITRHHMI